MRENLFIIIQVIVHIKMMQQHVNIIATYILFFQVDDEIYSCFYERI